MTTAVLTIDAWPAAVASLTAIRERGEPLPTSVVSHIAQLCGKSPRTMWRWVERGSAPTYGRSSYAPNEAEYAAYARWHGNAAAVHRELHAGRPGAPTLRTLQRAFDRLTPGEQAMVRRGVGARREEELNLMQTYTRRNELWVADHSQLNCLVLPTRGTRPQRPWSTMFVDAATRAITGWVLSVQPTQATVLSGLRRGVLRKQDAEQLLICGRPEMLQTDNGMEFTADRVTAAVVLMGGSARTVRTYSPQLNGIVERLHRTMDSTWLAGQPFYSDSARGHDGEHTRPGGCLPTTFTEFVAEFAVWVHHYNCERPHGSLDGQTPLQVWTADNTPLHVPDEALLDYMLDTPVSRKVRDYGIELGGLWYSDPALNDYVGQTVDVRTPVNETHFVDVYVGRRKVCRATPQENWTEDARSAFMAGRRGSRRRMNQARRGATAAHVLVLNQQRALVDEPGQQASDGALASSHASLNRSPETDLLGLDIEPEDDPVAHSSAVNRRPTAAAIEEDA